MDKSEEAQLEDALLRSVLEQSELELTESALMQMYSQVEQEVGERTRTPKPSGVLEEKSSPEAKKRLTKQLRY